MSAWIVNREHIDVMLSFGLAHQRDIYWSSEHDDANDGYRQLHHGNADDIGRLLWTENICSVAARYPDDTPDSRPGPVSEDIDGEAIEYTYLDPGYVMAPGEALKAVACFEYQSCEHDGWNESEARQFCKALFHKAASMLYDGPWGWDADELSKRPKSFPIFRV